MKSRNLRVTVIALISLTLLFSAVFGLGVLNVAAEKAEDLYDSKTGRTLVDSDSDGFYDIGSADMLDTFSSLVNTNPSINGELTGDITYNTGDLSTLTGKTDGKREFTPIGWLLKTDDTNQHTYVDYTGHFNGNGYKISGLYFFYGMSYDAIGGLFASLGNGAKVYDLTVERSYFAGVSYMGAIAGQMQGVSSIENCHNVGSYVGGSTRIGGIVGEADGRSCIIKTCSNSGKVDYFKVNESIDRSLECFGGIVGSCINNAKITGCFNGGIIDATGAETVGGIAGQIFDGGSIERCMNSGNVITDSGNVGGIVGFAYNDGGISKCLNMGFVKGKERLGHVYGGANTPKSYSEIYYNDTFEIIREDLSDTVDANKCEKVTDTQLESGELAYMLGESFGQNIDNSETNEGKPVFGGERVYYGYTSCDKEGVAVYSNREISDERPEHSYIYQANGATIGAYCINCGGTGGFTLVVDHAEREYNGEAAVVTVIGEIHGVEKPSVSTYIKGAPALPKDVGERVSKINIDGVEAKIEYKITPKKLTPSLQGSVSKVYDGTVTVTGSLGIALFGVVGSETVNASADFVYASANVGTVTVNATNITLTGDYTKNYELTTTSASGNVGEITKAESGVTSAPTANTLKYSGGEQALVTAGEVVGGTLKYSLDESFWSEEIPTGVALGTYKVYYKVFGDDNHNDSDVSFVDVVIGKADAVITLKPSAFLLEYNGSEQVLANIGIASGGTVKYSLDGVNFSESMPKGKNAGTYKVYYKAFGNDNYSDSDVEFIEVTVSKRIVKVTAEDKTVEQYLGFPTFTYKIDGFLPGEEGELSKAPTVGVSIKDTNAAGSFSITPSGGSVGENYQLAYSAGTLVITPHTEHRAMADACETKPICAICKEAFGEAAGHTDVDGDLICDVCNGPLKKNGLSAGAVTGIAVGGTATVGLGGFLIFWFVIKKKKLSDLLAIFKK